MASEICSPLILKIIDRRKWEISQKMLAFMRSRHGNGAFGKFLLPTPFTKFLLLAENFESLRAQMLNCFFIFIFIFLFCFFSFFLFFLRFKLKYVHEDRRRRPFLCKRKKSKEKMYQVGVLKVIDSKSINAICGSEQGGACAQFSYHFNILMVR